MLYTADKKSFNYPYNLGAGTSAFSTVRLGTGDNRDNNLKRRGFHERRTNGFVQA